MLVIRASQMKVFRNEARRSFEDQLLRRVASRLEEKGAGVAGDRLAVRIRSEIEFARGFGFQSERDVARYVELACLLSPGGGLPLEARRLLRATDVAPSVRLDRLAAWVESPESAEPES